MSAPRPPRLARTLLRFLLPAEVHDAFAGDLEERFQRTAALNPGAARRAYWRDVLSPTVIRLRRELRGADLPSGSPPNTRRGDGIVLGLLSELKFATRVLRKSPGFTAVAVLSLALGIGPNTAIFSLVDAVLYEDWGVGQPEGLVDVYSLTDAGEHFFNYHSTYELVRDGADDVFESVANHSIFMGRIEDEAGDSERALGEMVTGNYFDVMRVPAQLGRTFLPEEDATEGTHPVVVLGDRFWRTRYGADPGIVGREIRLNARPYTVVGVAAPDFRGRVAPGLGTSFWVPFSMYPHLVPSKMTMGDLTISGRVRPGVDAREAVAAVTTLASREEERLRAEYGAEGRSPFRLAGVPLSDVKLNPNLDGALTMMAALLFFAVGLVLLVACVNLAGFLLSRATDRRKEMAVRVAMGARGRTIARQLVIESLLLSTLGGAVGLVLGQLAIRALVSVETPIGIPVDLEVGLDLPLLLFTLGTVAVASVVFGLTPALEAMRAPVAATLRDEAGSSGGRRSVSARGLLVGAQMALSTILLFGAGLFVRSLHAASEMDLGFAARDVAVVKFETSTNEYSGAEAAAFVEELRRRVQASPEVRTATYTGRMPLDVGNILMSFDVPGVEPPPNRRRHSLEFAPVGPGYFETMGIDVLEGRGIEESDRDGSVPVAVLSRAAAQRFWPGGSAVGKTLVVDAEAGSTLTVVGIVDDVKIWSLSEADRPYMYLPYHQGQEATGFALVASGSASGAEVAAAVRREALAIDPDVFMTAVGTMNDHLGYAFFLPRMAALVLSMIGVLALVLACVGLYGMVSYGVARRTREMGIRLALGAERGEVVRLVLRGGLILASVGATLGLAGAVALGRGAERFLVAVDGLDALTLVGAPLLLVVVAATASYLPARRAARVDPVRALRSE